MFAFTLGIRRNPHIIEGTRYKLFTFTELGNLDKTIDGTKKMNWFKHL